MNAGVLTYEAWVKEEKANSVDPNTRKPSWTKAINTITNMMPKPTMSFAQTDSVLASCEATIEPQQMQFITPIAQVSNN